MALWIMKTRLGKLLSFKSMAMSPLIPPQLLVTKNQDGAGQNAKLKVSVVHKPISDITFSAGVLLSGKSLLVT